MSYLLWIGIWMVTAFQSLPIVESNYCLKRELKIVYEIRALEKAQFEKTIDSIKQIVSKPYEPTFASNSLFGDVYNYMKQKLHCPEANFSLAVHESDRFRSSFFKKSNNMFCMGVSKRPYDFKVWNSGDGNYKAGFDDWKKSIDDMAAWQSNKLSVLDTTSNEAYIASLKKIGYAEDVSHSKKVQRTYKSLFREIDIAQQIVDL